MQDCVHQQYDRFFFFGIFALCDSIAYLPVLFTILSACAPKLISIHWKDSVYQCLNCVPNIKKKQYLKLQSDGIVTGLTLRQSRAALFSTVLVFPHYIAAVQVPTSLIPACNEWSIRRSWEMASTAIDASFAEKPVIVHRSFTLEQWMPKSRFDTSYIYNTGYIMFVLFLPDWNPVPETSCEEQLQKPWSNQKISIVFSDSHSLAFVVLAPMKPLNQGREKNISKTSHVIGFALRKRRFQMPLYSGATEASEVMWRSKEWGVYFMIGAEKKSCLSIIIYEYIHVYVYIEDSGAVVVLLCNLRACCRNNIRLVKYHDLPRKRPFDCWRWICFIFFFWGSFKWKYDNSWHQESTTVVTCLIIESNNYIYHKCLYLFTLSLTNFTSNIYHIP